MRIFTRRFSGATIRIAAIFFPFFLSKIRNFLKYIRDILGYILCSRRYDRSIVGYI